MTECVQRMINIAEYDTIYHFFGTSEEREGMYKVGITLSQISSKMPDLDPNTLTKINELTAKLAFKIT